MALNIKNEEADHLARELARRTGQTITEVVIGALRDRLAREEGRASAPSLVEQIMGISRRCAALPEYDTRSPAEIIGYDRHGLPS